MFVFSLRDEFVFQPIKMFSNHPSISKNNNELIRSNTETSWAPYGVRPASPRSYLDFEK